MDDDRCLRRALSRQLSTVADVVTAPTVGEALTLLGERHDFDLVLSDMMMPGGSGKDLFEALTANYPALAERTVFMTAGVTKPELQSFIEKHHARVLCKPVPRGVILALLTRSFATASSPEEVAPPCPTAREARDRAEPSSPDHGLGLRWPQGPGAGRGTR